MFYLLDSVTRKGEQRLEQHGKIWKDMNHASPLQSESLYLQSVKTGDCRWVKLQGDDNFDIVEGLENLDEFLEEETIL